MDHAHTLFQSMVIITAAAGSLLESLRPHLQLQCCQHAPARVVFMSVTRQPKGADAYKSFLITPKLQQRTVPLAHDLLHVAHGVLHRVDLQRAGEHFLTDKMPYCIYVFANI